MASGGPLGSKVFLGMGADTKEWGWVRRGWCVEKVHREKESCMHAKIWQSSLRTDGGRRSPCKQAATGLGMSLERWKWRTRRMEIAYLSPSLVWPLGSQVESVPMHQWLKQSDEGQEESWIC